ncbi:MAG: pyrimidine dimer DNA glycosylase/endonuclease V [Candidatus Nitrosocaldus sp.]|nr:pyrimidine dimer DNA glycosylase/endonuclease V [Candidatus Nitrosocaldus sp.]MDW8000040.1 pyrimidine dimer DNA glycosylase/endonuclease V [Candidatus Nitrosocaldus sp.]
MVRINLIDPLYLMDQHLLAEHNEMLMLISYFRRYPLTRDDASRIPERFVLGRGHMIFFKDKLLYIKRRHDEIREEMARRGYRSRRVISIDCFPRTMLRDWRPDAHDVTIIKARLIERVRSKPWLYTYYGRRLALDTLIRLIEDATWH